MWCLSTCKDSIELSSSNIHAVARLHFLLALRSSKKHLLITKFKDLYPAKGMIVRLIRSQPQLCTNIHAASDPLPEIATIFIGSVYLNRARYSVGPSRIAVKIGKGTGLGELDQGDIACHYVSKAKANLRGPPSWENGELSPLG